MALPKFEDYKAPWEVDAQGNPIEPDKQETDPEKLKKHLWNVLSDKEKAQAARDAALGKTTELTSKVTELEAAVQGKANEGKTELEKLQASIDALTERATKAEFEKDRMSVLTEHKIRPDAHDLLTGKTLDELKASAEKLVALGLVEKEGSTGEGNGGGDGNNGGGNPLETQPKPRSNPGDPNPGGGGDDISVDDFAKQYGGNTFPL